MLIFLGLYLFIILMLLAFNFWLGYDVGRNAMAVQETKKQIYSSAHAAGSLASLKADFEKAKNDRLFLESIVPQPEKIINFPRELTVLAKQNNVELAFGFGTEFESAETTPGFVNFNMVLGGVLVNWLKFLEILEKSRYLMSLDSFNIVSDGRDYRVSINGKVFTQ